MDAHNRNNIIAFPGNPPSGALELRVDLMLMRWPVWRRIVVPARYTFWDLHVAIQDAMGWEDRHLHLFTVDDHRAEERLRFGIPDDSGFHGVHAILPGWQHPVAPFMRVGGHPLLYTYDFGDMWQHEVNLEAIRSGPDAPIQPQCLAGEGACPAEDSGGPEAQRQRPGAQPTFDAASVVFDDPRARWRLAFDHD